MRRRPSLALALAACLLASAAAFSGCAALLDLQPPAVSFRGVETRGVSFQGADFLVTFRVDNPNRFALALGGMDWSVRFGDTPVLQGRSDEDRSIAAGSGATVELPLSLRFADVWRAVQGLRETGDSRWVLSAGLLFDLPGGRQVRVPVTGRGDLPILHTPEVNLVGLKLDDLTASGAGLVLTLDVSNPNPFPAELERLDWQLAVAGQTWTTGTVDEPIRLGPQEHRTLTVPVTLKFAGLGEVGASVTRLLLRSEPVPFELRGGLVNLRARLPEFGTAEDEGAPFSDAGEVEIRR